MSLKSARCESVDAQNVLCVNHFDTYRAADCDIQNLHMPSATFNTLFALKLSTEETAVNIFSKLYK